MKPNLFQTNDERNHGPDSGQLLGAAALPRLRHASGRTLPDCRALHLLLDLAQLLLYEGHDEPTKHIHVHKARSTWHCSRGWHGRTLQRYGMESFEEYSYDSYDTHFRRL